jgi:ribonucleotide reductase beta subunit family protein with ferritin-like domain
VVGLPKIYKETNPYSWMSMLGLGGKQNFFEGRVPEYKRADVNGGRCDPRVGLTAN